MASGHCWLLLGLVLAFGVAASPVQASRPANHYDFYIKEMKITRLCKEKTILAVNDQFPGPTIYARRGDVVVVNVYNQGNKSITLHWHGVDNPRNPWVDGPEYITQCPIQPGANFTYTVNFTEEEGTLWWHAHTDYDRNTVHGAIVIYPKRGSAYPYPKPDKEIPIILGEWWYADTETLYEETHRGADVNVSDANTINGQPGDQFNCSKNGTFRVLVEHGKTYLLRIINAGFTNDTFFGVAGHRLTVVGTDGRYLKPFTVEAMMIAPGQTMNALLVADRPTNGSANSRYYMVGRTFGGNILQLKAGNATAILEYTDAPPSAGPPDFIELSDDDNAVSTAFTAQLRSLVTKDHPIDVPTHVDQHMYVTISVNFLPCGSNDTCSGPVKNTRLGASMNNVSFVAPSIAILEAYYNSIQAYETNFPNKPPSIFNFTNPYALELDHSFTKRGTKVKELEYGTVVEVVFQDTAILAAESHPIHLHGFSFYVVGRGFGNYDLETHTPTYNLVDPPYQNTVSVPKAGWAAIRFRAANPGVWYMHCHVERHQVWGMNTVFIVKNGKTPDAQMMPRPPTMPKC